MDYISRHIGPDQSEQRKMLDALGYESLDALISAAVPKGILADGPLQLPQALTEYEAQDRLREIASQNTVLKAFYGQGYNSTLTPPVIRRGVIEDAGWYTAYTPYQPEISQGRLEALLNFQTMVQDLTGLDIANASLLDEASAAAEAVGLMSRAVRKGRRVLLDARLHPQVITVAAERARAIDLEVEVADLSEGVVGEDLVGAVLAYPGTEGDIADPRPVIEAIHERGGLVTVDADILALTVLESPGELGADIAIGSSQRFGVPLFYGGPHAAFMAVPEKLKRQLPGRLVGVSKDAEGFPAYRLALQTREQHIRRERATSNICTAQALLAVAASMYAVYHGPAGLTEIARTVHDFAARFAAGVEVAGARVKHAHFFDTVAVEVSDAQGVVDKLAQAGYLVRSIDATTVGVSFGEDTSEADLAALLDAFGATAPESAEPRLPEALERRTEFLTHETFNAIHSETQMMRYIRTLGDKDLALDRTMIPLGSCTMKLNPTAGLETITWPEFANVHPFTPAEYTKGWATLIDDLRTWLISITGYAEVSLQPNSGATGELAGLLAIRRYHVANGDTERDICLIPASAHGTNAASASLANLRVVVIKTADDGSIDLNDLDAQLEKHGEHVAAIMLTYPSTHGVYEDTVRTVADKVHAAGGQVYIDGANMNALTGIARPGDFGGDVSHLNLHKTFTIPHGGGGPGVGPIGVGEHLIPFLPGDANVSLEQASAPVPGDAGVPVSASLYGSAGVLQISWAYIAMSGADGLKSATQHAVLGANYLAHQLNEYFPVLYTGDNGMVGHECILDLRELTDKSGVTAADVAKRLVDYGFHAPTLSFPVAGTLMVEPTESEDLAELDRFVEAMRSIHGEIQEIIDGRVAYESSVLHHAPFTAHSVVRSDWPYEFSREQAAYPVDRLVHAKYFPPVRRIDEAYGDRNLVCACPPPEAFGINTGE
ncbi:aminomethyl-transferring glycine dehydrogenase [Corynebacterium gottingense]|uniref:glycine dehydrogenase (aminomethyl-transferring) n=1 Tax=Corynebacterium gottingense TaxID=2041036 RepID=A0ABX9UKB1_9CORY|nr:aminomethyl-transferring glycine dehydrogenase [Corynebacterium gottingense]RMD19798.1 glycine dehydrogenase (aminomethyl-transferring) [Corynebacterium gottingense]WJZ13532.1 Glycine dehydrogenase (decarboxylating) [Corynebacterium gottingense]WJZ15850.1 Glycine dehydrogenase (decarboxylating) [Corynebacterium gottingense]